MRGLIYKIQSIYKCIQWEQKMCTNISRFLIYVSDIIYQDDTVYWIVCILYVCKVYVYFIYIIYIYYIIYVCIYILYNICIIYIIYIYRSRGATPKIDHMLALWTVLRKRNTARHWRFMLNSRTSMRAPYVDDFYTHGAGSLLPTHPTVCAIRTLAMQWAKLGK